VAVKYSYEIVRGKVGNVKKKLSAPIVGSENARERAIKLVQGHTIPKAIW
jgi:hypothetical protein